VKDISLREKLILIFMFLGLGAIAIVSIFSFYSTKDALLTRTFDQLTSLRIVKEKQIESFFSDRSREALMMMHAPEADWMWNQINRPGPAKLGITPVKLDDRVFNHVGKSILQDKYFSRMVLFSGSGKAGI
jgi:hypothetical protein